MYFTNVKVSDGVYESGVKPTMKKRTDLAISPLLLRGRGHKFSGFPDRDK